MVHASQAKAREGGYFRLDQQCDQYSDKVIGQIVMKQCDQQARLRELKAVEEVHESQEDQEVQKLLKRAYNYKRNRSVDSSPSSDEAKGGPVMKRAKLN